MHEATLPPLFSSRERGKKRLVILDGKKGKAYDAIALIGGGKVISDRSDELHSLAQEDDPILLVGERNRRTEVGARWTNEGVERVTGLLEEVVRMDGPGRLGFWSQG